MKRRIRAVLIALLMIGMMSACGAMPRGLEAQDDRSGSFAPGNIDPKLAAQETRPPEPSKNEPEVPKPSKNEPEKPKPSENEPEMPEPAFDAPWYTDRNKEIGESIERYHPEESKDQIERDIARMAIDPDRPMVALTFDDGPVPGVTDKILDILEENNARATFFVLGWRFDKLENHDILRRMAALGCEIGNHTWSHRKLGGQNYVSVRYEIENTNDVIFQIAGVRPRSFRPPGGANTYEATRVTRENGMEIVLWSQSGNVHETDPERIAQNVEKQIVNGKELHDGDVILLHDTPQCMVDAVKIIVPRLIKEGYQLVTVWELLNCSGEEIVPGKVYQER